MRRWWFCLLFPSLAHAQGQPVVAVFELEAPPGVVTAQEQATLGRIIANELAVSRRFKLVPPQEVRRALLEKKRESYKDCYDESCQIEIGKELAASHSLGCSLQRLGSECIISLTLYDLRESVTAGAAQKTGGCAPDALARLAKAAAQELGGAKTSSARDEPSSPPPPPLQSTDYAAFAAEVEAPLAALKTGKEPAGGASGGMVRVPGGPFFMGCNPKVDTECDDDEKPGKTVQVAAFKIDKVEVTVAAYAACVKAGACTPPDTGRWCNWGKNDRYNHPINCVDWNQATTYCGWAKKRLPTEAEWEKAARGTDGLKYPWGNQFDPAKANLKGSGDGFEQTAPVGSFKAGASPYGALDMAGNVWEWVSDWYMNGEERSIRGGNWRFRPRIARASERYWNVPHLRFGPLGFRCAQSE